MTQMQEVESLARFIGVTYGYTRDQCVVDNVTLDVRKGEVLTVVGRSGCGKTTLLNLLAGLIQPWEGLVEFAGRPITAYNTDVGYMTQDDTLLPWHTVWRNVALPLKLRKQPRELIDSEVRRHLELFGLASAGKKFPAQLSGGMKRRALLARSMIYQPSMLLMDEPFSALDAPMREELQAELRRTSEALDQTVLFVTHDVAEAVLISDRIVVIAGGRGGGIAAITEVPFGPGRDISELAVSSDALDLQREIRRTLDVASKQVEGTA